MIFFELLTVCTALRWSKTGIPLKKAERKSAKAERREKLSEPCIVHYTSQQASIAQEAGLDTSNWTVDSDSTFSKVERASSTFVKSWSNPEGFSADHLRIPFRFKTENFNEKSMQKMAGWLDDMSGYVGGCIEFYDDTNTQLYPKDYILIRNTDNSGTYDSRCWSRLGRANYYGPVVLSYQEINMGNRCIYKDTMQHEMLHSLGFKHEQQRPDRDEFVDILYENIQPHYKYAFDKMSVKYWDNYEQIYDFASVMHYDGDLLLTDEARYAYKSSIVYKGTMNEVYINAGEMSSIDIVQLTRRYSAFCKEPTDKIPCSTDEKDGYFLPWKACNGYHDCKNGYDEGDEQCGHVVDRRFPCSNDNQYGSYRVDQACDGRKWCHNGYDESFEVCVDRWGSHLYVQGLESIEGDYFVFGQSLYSPKTSHKRLAYYNEEKKVYLYYNRPRWYFSSTLGESKNKLFPNSLEAWELDIRSVSPIGLSYRVKVNKKWIVLPDISVTLANNRTTTESVPLSTTIPSTTTSTTKSTTTPKAQRNEQTTQAKSP